MRIYCDFDGTISLQDTSQLVLSYLADPAWQTIELEWEEGLIGSAECMRRQIAMIKASPEELDGVLDEITLDMGFLELVDFCAQNRVPLTIISDGVDYFIRRVLASHGIAGIEIVANRLAFDPDKGFSLSSPHGAANCVSAAGTCKCAATGLHSRSAIFIGDGRSDFCVAGRGLTVFAKGRLAEYCKGNKIDFFPFKTLDNIIPTLRDLLVRVPAITAA